MRRIGACRRIGARAIDYLDGMLARTEALAFEEHLASCNRCASAIKDARRARESLEWALGCEEEPPEWLRRSVFDAVSRDPEVRHRAPGPISITLGILTTVLASLALQVRSGLPPIPVWVAIACGATWVSLFTAFYYAALSRESDKTWGAFRLSHLSLCGLGAMGLYLLGSALMPVATLARTATGTLSIGEPAVLFFAGAAYALVPMLICASFLCARSRCSQMAYAVLPSAMFLLLLAPGILVECVRFTAGAVAGLSLGSLLGAVLGSLAGAGIGPLVIPVFLGSRRKPSS